MLIGIKEVVVIKLLFHMEEEAILQLVMPWDLTIIIHLMLMVGIGNGMLIFLNQDAVAMQQCILFQCQEKIGMEIQILLKDTTSTVMQIK